MYFFDFKEVVSLLKGRFDLLQLIRTLYLASYSHKSIHIIRYLITYTVIALYDEKCVGMIK